MRTSPPLLVLLALLVGACGADRAGPTRLRLATTTSTENSGLLDWLLPPFEAREGIDVDPIAVGTGQALKIAMNGDADVLLVHDRPREDAFVADGYGIDRRDLMWNDFVIAGPPADPAGVRGTTDAAAALRRIAETKAVFVSRADSSGTHARELLLWEKAGGRPAWDDYVASGRGMGPCLTIADEKQGYVLADRGTFLAFAPRVDLKILVEGDVDLRNPYGVILVNPQRHPHVRIEAAKKLLDYLTSPEGQKRIGDYRRDGAILFHPQTEP